MPQSARHRWLLLCVPLALRLALVWLVDDFEDDAYARDLTAWHMSNALRGGTFTLGTLLYANVWLPAWHVLCAVVEVVVRQPYWVPKVLSATFGGASPMIVFATAERLSSDRRVAWWAWGLASFAPLHALYSSMGMTEAFYGFWLALSTYAFLRAERGNRWLLVSAVALFPATWTRFEGWFLIGVLPLVALAQRRARFGTWMLAGVLWALPAVAYFAINWRVTGDWMHFARASREVIRRSIEFRGSEFGSRGPIAIGRHLLRASAANGVVLTALALLAAVRVRTRDMRAALSFFVTTFGLLFGLWLARRHVAWRRYYVPFAMPLSVFGAIGLDQCRSWLGRRAGRVALAAVLVEMCVAAGFQARLMLRWVRPWVAIRRDVAAFLRPRAGLIFCDEPTVRLYSALPADRFVNQWGFAHDAPRAVGQMRARGVRWVVYAGIDYSLLPELFPWMQRGESRVPFTLRTRFVTFGRGNDAFPLHVYELASEP